MLSFVCASFLSLGFSKGGNKSIAESYHAVSAKDVFRSVVFADGPLTSKVASLKKYDVSKRSLTNGQIREYKNMEDRIMNHLEKNDLNYFENFKSVIGSQDLNLISNSLETVSNDILIFLEKEKEVNRVEEENNLKRYENNSEKSIGVKDVEMIAEPCEAVVVALAVIIIFVILANSPDSPAGLIKSFQEKSLAHDKLVVDISNMLS